MTTTLTPDQVRAIAARPGEPITLTDPDSRRAYVLLPAEVYERLLAVAGDDPVPRDAYAAADRAFAEGWGAPGMDEYDRYEEIRP